MLGSVGRQSRAEGLDRLSGYVATATEAQIATVATDLISVGTMLRAEIRLRRALVDPARSSSDRVGLLTSLLGTSISTAAQDMVSALVAGRWSGHGEFLHAVEQLGVIALLSGAERTGALADIEDELFRFGQIVAGDQHLATALGDTTVPPSRRAELVRSLLAGRVLPETIALAVYALDGPGGRGFAAALTWLVELTAAQRMATIAYVTVAAPLADAAEQRLAGALGERYHRTMSLNVDVDPAVIGGVRVVIGSDLYDGTVQRRLADARSAMTR